MAQKQNVCAFASAECWTPSMKLVPYAPWPCPILEGKWLEEEQPRVPVDPPKKQGGHTVLYY